MPIASGSDIRSYAKRATESLLLNIGLGSRRNRQWRDLTALAQKRTGTRALGVACTGRSDGGGAQIHAQISAFAYGKAAGLPFFYAPLISVEHGRGDDWVAQWNAVLDFQSDSQFRLPDAPQMDVHAFLRNRGHPAAVVAMTHFHAYCDRRPEFYLQLQDELRERCRLVEPSIAEGVIAVHIRRGDVVGDPKSRSRLTPIRTVNQCLVNLRKSYPAHRIEIHSEGRPEDFAGIDQDVDLRLDEDVFQTLQRLINAEVLVMAKSSFSYVAALLSRGQVIYEPFWHPKLPHWQTQASLLSQTGG